MHRIEVLACRISEDKWYFSAAGTITAGTDARPDHSTRPDGSENDRSAVDGVVLLVKEPSPDRDPSGKGDSLRATIKQDPSIVPLLELPLNMARISAPHDLSTVVRQVYYFRSVRYSFAQRLEQQEFAIIFEGLREEEDQTKRQREEARFDLDVYRTFIRGFEVNMDRLERESADLREPLTTLEEKEAGSDRSWIMRGLLEELNTVGECKAEGAATSQDR